jgi:hypothetical protein
MPRRIARIAHLPLTELESALSVLVLVAVALLLAGTAQADSDESEARPSEMPYDTPGSVPQLSPDYRQTNHKVVLITDDTLSPRTVKLKEGQLVAWISYSHAASTIVFEREVARSMICHSLVNFSIQDDELRSEPIHPGEFASFCELKPGRYGYIVTRKAKGMEAHIQAQDRLRGEIIVGDG